MNERVATYVMDDVSFDIIANYNSGRDMDDRNVSFYSVYNNKTESRVSGTVGLTDFPTWQEVFDAYYQKA